MYSFMDDSLYLPEIRECGREITISRRQAIYAFIVRFKTVHDGNGPTIRQIGAAIGDNTVPVSTSVVHYHLNMLEKHGSIIRGEGGIEIVGGRWLGPVQVAVIRKSLEEEAS